MLMLVVAALCALPPADEADPDDADATPDPVERETVLEAPADAGYLYSADLSDEELEKGFLDDLSSLGSVSVGLAEAGRLINGVQVQPSAHVEVVTPENAWGTAETVEYLNAVALDVAAAVPGAAPLRVNHIGKREGGYLRPHFSHQSGRDVDVGFYYPPGTDLRNLPQSRIATMDLEANWALVKALAAKADVQVVLLDRKVQAALAAYGLSRGEDPALVDKLFHSGAQSLFQHARRHKDHFHVRFFAPRSQELGRRVQPLLAKRPDENKIVHRVRAGETLGHLAAKYGTTVKLIQKASGLAGTMLSIGRTLVVPLRGPCTQCPVAAPVIVPPRLISSAAVP
ncbi:MAG: LysM peptidoglycan-binding domain-containing protein [Archangiaceae bacterium]|nr:LysM peptidoglycan-binding domain-containing protein [Archangiaceae bacterium]